MSPRSPVFWIGLLATISLVGACWAWYRAGFTRGIETLEREAMNRRDAEHWG